MDVATMLKTIELPMGSMYSAVEIAPDVSASIDTIAFYVVEAVERRSAEPVYVNYDDGWLIAFAMPEGETA